MAEDGEEKLPVSQLSDKQQEQVLQFMVAEHSALQTARSATIFDASGRATLFLSTVSSAVVALAFVGQVAGMGTEFFTFALVLFPTLFFLGLVTFERTLQSAVEDTIYARGINRIRHYYVELAPQMKEYFILSTHDDQAGVMQSMGLRQAWWQLFLTTAGMISVINSVLAGVVAGLLASWLVSASLTLAVGAGATAFGVSLFLHYRHERRVWQDVEQSLPVRFPSSETEYDK